MKHGDKAKGKTAKAKASGKKGSSKVAAKGKASPRQSTKPKKQASVKAIGKASSAERGGNGKGRSRGSVPENVGFTNPIVAAAFKRAVKKYPIAFKRLAD